MRSSVGPVPETDTTVASQSSYTKVLSRGGSCQDVCGELIGVGQNRPVQRPPLSVTFCGDRYATTQSLTFIVTLPRIVNLLCSSLPDSWNAHIGRSNPTSCNNTYFILSKVCLSSPLIHMNFDDYPTNENRGEKKNQDQQKCQFSRRPIGSSQQNAANQHRVFDAISKCIVGKRTDFPDLQPRTSD